MAAPRRFTRAPILGREADAIGATAGGSVSFARSGPPSTPLPGRKLQISAVRFPGSRSEVYSDRLAELRLKRLDPAYRDKQRAPAAAPDPGGPGLVLEMVYPGDPATGLPPVMVRDPVPPTGPPAADALTHERPGRNGDSGLIAAATPRLRPRES